MNSKLQLGLGDNERLLDLVRDPFNCYALLIRMKVKEREALQFIQAIISLLREPSFLLTQVHLDQGELQRWESLFSWVQECLNKSQEGIHLDYKPPLDPRRRGLGAISSDQRDSSTSAQTDCGSTQETDESSRKKRRIHTDHEKVHVIDCTRDDDSSLEVIDLTDEPEIEEGELQ